MELVTGSNCNQTFIKIFGQWTENNYRHIMNGTGSEALWSILVKVLVFSACISIMDFNMRAVLLSVYQYAL